MNRPNLRWHSLDGQVVSRLAPPTALRFRLNRRTLQPYRLISLAFTASNSSCRSHASGYSIDPGPSGSAKETPVSDDPQSVLPPSEPDHGDLFQLANDVRQTSKQISAKGEAASATAMRAIRMGEDACKAAQALLRRLNEREQE